MKTCKDCIHQKICVHYVKLLSKSKGIDFDNLIEPYCEKAEADKCEYFQDRSKFIELPDFDEYGTTLDKAIDHCFSIATSTDENIHIECKDELLRLCGWLGELKSKVEVERALNE